MNNIILTQIPAQATFEFDIITSVELNPSFIMLTVKFINDLIEIYFSACIFHFKVYQCYPIFRKFWEMFPLISFFKNFSRTQHWSREKLQLPVTIKGSFLRSYKGQYLIDWYRQLPLSPKQIVCQSYFTFQIIFTKWIWFVASFKCVCDGNVWPPGQRVEIGERIASESLQKIHTKFYEVAGHVGRVKTVVTNHIRNMFRSCIHKAAEYNITTIINWDKLTETNP